MKKRSFLSLILLILILSLPVQAQSDRERWIKAVDDWCNIMENDGNWIYVSGGGEITDYKKNRSTQRYSNCALMVTHALQYMGVLNSKQKIYAKVSKSTIKTVYSGTGTEAAIKKYCDVIHIGGKKTTSDLLREGSLLKGDIICYYGMQHTVVYKGSIGNDSYWYDAGRGGTSTKKARGLWNKTYSLTRVFDGRYLTSDTWKVNEIIRFRGEVHSQAALSITSCKVSNNNVYATFTIKNNCDGKESFQYGMADSTGNAINGKNGSFSKVVLDSGESKTFANIKLGKWNSKCSLFLIKSDCGSKAQSGITVDHLSPKLTKVSYKIKNKRLYLTYTITNPCPVSEKITVSALLGTKTSAGKGISKTVTLLPGKSKKYTQIKVSNSKVNASRRYLTMKISSHGKTISYKAKKLKLK